jgi:hypothetical protein
VKRFTTSHLIKCLFELLPLIRNDCSQTSPFFCVPCGWKSGFSAVDLNHTGLVSYFGFRMLLPTSHMAKGIFFGWGSKKYTLGGYQGCRKWSSFSRQSNSSKLLRHARTYSRWIQQGLEAKLALGQLFQLMVPVVLKKRPGVRSP